eukprot:1181893-Prorocentrum_minimum.AAC.1
MDIFSLPFCDWCPLWVYSLFPSAIGARYGYILSSLPQLVPATGIFSLPFCRTAAIVAPRMHMLRMPPASTLSGGPSH